MPPTGFKRSRALWDNARRPHATMGEAIRAYLRAIQYECQPIRSSVVPGRGLSLLLHRMKEWTIQTARSIPGLAQTFYVFLSNRSKREWVWAAGVLVYYVVVRWIHSVLEAGPIILILTALVGIFTIGLGDDTNADGISAYSVFNRGFERLMGTIDAEDLVAQQMGGGLRLDRRHNNAENAERIVRPLPPRQPLPPPQQQQRNEREDEGIDNAERVEGDPPPEAEAGNQDRPQQGRARLSGKKSRRRNLEQRRELRRQREAAMAMGFGADEHAEALAMQRLLDEDIAEHD